MSVELEVREGGVLDAEAVRMALDRAVEAGATDELFNAAVRADAQRLYESERGLRAAALRLTRLVVECSAAIGDIDVRAHPMAGPPGGHPPLILAGQSLGPVKRTRYRNLGVARQRATLDRRIEEVAEREGELSINSVGERASQMGDGWVATVELEKAAKAAGRKVGAVARAAGTSYPGSIRTSWPRARLFALALGVDPLSLAPSPARRPKKQRGRWLTRAHRPTGGRWDEAYSHHRRLLDEIQRLVPNADPRYDPIYAHLYAIEDFLGRRMRQA